MPTIVIDSHGSQFLELQIDRRPSSDNFTEDGHTFTPQLLEVEGNVEVFAGQNIPPSNCFWLSQSELLPPNYSERFYVLAG